MDRFEEQLENMIEFYKNPQVVDMPNYYLINTVLRNYREFKDNKKPNHFQEDHKINMSINSKKIDTFNNNIDVINEPIPIIQELIYSNQNDFWSIKLYRTQTIGGWLITQEDIRDNNLATSMCFVPDENHDWVIE